MLSAQHLQLCTKRTLGFFLQWTNSIRTKYELVMRLHVRSVSTRPYRVDHPVDFFSDIVVVPGISYQVQYHCASIFNLGYWSTWEVE